MTEDEARAAEIGTALVAYREAVRRDTLAGVRCLVFMGDRNCRGRFVNPENWCETCTAREAKAGEEAQGE